MKAIQIDAFGSSGVLHLRDVIRPTLGEREVLVAVRTASINHADIKVRMGDPHYVNADQLPLILGRDMSGRVVAKGKAVDDFQIGEEVFAVTTRGLEGCYAEFVALPANLCARRPPALSPGAAAALALCGLTALTALKMTAHLRAEEVVFIHGGAGGVGSFAVQYARSIGARVIATASRRNHAYVRQLGAEKVYDYYYEDFTSLGAGCDVVLETVGGDVRRRSMSILKPGGRLICVGGQIEGLRQLRSDISVIRPTIARDGKYLDEVAALTVSGAVHPPDIRFLPLSAARAAHELLEAGKVRGKLVLEI